MVGEDEDLRGSDWVEPAFYPAPNCREEGRCSDYLFPTISSCFRSIRGMGRYLQRFGPGFPGNEQ